LFVPIYSRFVLRIDCDMFPSFEGSKLGMAILPAGSDIRRISDPSGMGSGMKFDPWVLPVPDPILLRVGYGFDFLPAGTRRISENSDFRFSSYQYAS
jgi:hypothetical protein